jgi:hypothetical protein
MTVPLLSNFFAAIDDNKISKVGNDDRIVNAETLSDLPEDSDIMRAADEARMAMMTSVCAAALFGAGSQIPLASASGLMDSGEFGENSVEEGMLKRVAIVRNGMLIAQSLEHFNDRFARFPANIHP